VSRPTRIARLPSRRPLVFAHRGASAELPENTLAAYERAIEVGADGVECDVRLTRDGELICIHDRTVDRTSDGSGSVSSQRLDELQRLDFGSWHGGEPASVVTLTALLELLHDAGWPVQLLVEAKHPTRWGGRVEQRLLEALQRFGWTGAGSAPTPVTVMSFAKVALQRIHTMAPALPLVLLMEGAPTRRRIGLLPEFVGIAGPSLPQLRHDPGYVERAHLLGNQVYVWTVDDPLELTAMRELGVDAVITNRPAETIAQLDLPDAAVRPDQRPGSS
jgi:glycerophosphoryl diester phosphodiesterase